MLTEAKHPWWKDAIIYQIYPRSFQDSNDDGIGDLQGIRSRLDYLEDLGITAIWLSPIYPSPMADFGYDVADYTDIHPIFGTIDDFLELLRDVHQRGMKLILDFVPNHTSHQHPWFLESRSSRENPKRDWYIWKDPKPDGSPPNNWVSFFGGSAWEWDEKTAQYYLHLFLKEQPDLNWRNPEVVQAMLDMLRFWLERGVDGFRVDVIWLLIKDALFRDEPPNPEWTPDKPINRSLIHNRTQNQPETHELIRKFRAVLDEYGERLLVGEIALPYDQLAHYHGENLDECHLPFNFGLIFIPFLAPAIRKLIDEYEASLPPGGWPNWVLGNHDQDRIATEGRAGKANSRLAQMLLLTIRGTPTMYYGDEIGMPNVEIPFEKVQDPMALNEPGVARSRDLERTPMQWDATSYAGFSTVETWLPVADDYALRNVAIQQADPHSFLNLVKSIINIRKTSLALTRGTYESIPAGDDVIAYLRSEGEEKVLVVLNFSSQGKSLDLATAGGKGRIVLSTQMDRDEIVPLETLKIRPHEGIIIRLT